VAKLGAPGFMWDVPGSNVGGGGRHLSENEVFRLLRKIAKSGYKLCHVYPLVEPA